MKLLSVLPPFMSTGLQLRGKFSMAEKIVEYGVSVFLFGTSEIMAVEGDVGLLFLQAWLKLKLESFSELVNMHETFIEKAFLRE